MKLSEYTERLRAMNDHTADVAAEHGMRSPETLLAAEDALAFGMQTPIEPDDPEPEAGG